MLNVIRQDDNCLLSDMLRLKTIVAKMEKEWRKSDDLEFFNAQYGYPDGVNFGVAMERVMAASVKIEDAIVTLSKSINEAIRLS